MKSESVLFVFLVSLCLAEIIQVYGTDIGYHCQSSLDCQTGNGGRKSKCNSYSSVCVCTHDYLGNENTDELREYDIRAKCNYDNNCSYGYGECHIECKRNPEDDELDEDDHCRTVIFCDSKTICSVGCAPRKLWRWDAHKDWYGRIQEPFVSNFIPDTKTSVCYDPDRAVNSRPEGMLIKTSDIPGAGLGVFTEKFLERGTLFGPYKGIRGKGGTYNGSMSWRIVTQGPKDLIVDAADKSLSNWLRYVNMPNNAQSENLLAIQHAGEMYYLAFKSIQPGSELLVWYGDDYAEILGIKKHKRPKYTYGKDGYAGGKCLNMYTQKCYSDNAICISDICLCRNGSHARCGDCITDETVGGKCFGKNGDMCLKDENAVCWNGVCFCNDDSSKLKRKYVHDETYGGICQDWNQDCLLDRNAECIDGICQCKVGTSEVSGKCVTDSTETAKEVACPSCMHRTFELRNMPAMNKIMLQNILSKMDLENPECEANTVEPQTCEAPMYPALIENKCLTSHLTVHAVGITGILPDVELDVTVLIRECHAQRTGKASGCTNLADLDADTQAQLMQQLPHVKDAWETVTYTGEVCIL